MSMLLRKLHDTLRLPLVTPDACSLSMLDRQIIFQALMMVKKNRKQTSLQNLADVEFSAFS